MKWRIKDKENDRAIISDCGRYQISRFTCSGVDLYLVYHGGHEIGEARDGNKARRVAERHSKGVTA